MVSETWAVDELSVLVNTPVPVMTVLPDSGIALTVTVLPATGILKAAMVTVIGLGVLKGMLTSGVLNAPEGTAGTFCPLTWIMAIEGMAAGKSVVG